MKATAILNDLILEVTPTMHKIRRKSLHASVSSLLHGARLTVTSLGRNICSSTTEKHQIKRSNRLVGNIHLMSEVSEIYKNLCMKIIKNIKRPVVLVDWSDLDTCQKHFLIRASVSVDGRSLTLLEEVHPLNTKEKPSVHERFLERLKAILPKDCVPIIVTDAGFRGPWFKLVKSLGWDFVGRVRNRTFCKTLQENEWYPIKDLYLKSTLKAKNLGTYELCRRNSIECQMIVYRKKIQGRKDLTAKGHRARSNSHSQAHGISQREPWLLATSIAETSRVFATKIVSIYAQRMQIEESFRDVKSGLGLNQSNTKNKGRLEILLMIAHLAQFVLFLIGIAVSKSGKQLRYQASSITKKRVLSFQFVGLRAVKDKQLRLCKKDLITSFHLLTEIMNKNGKI